MRFIKWLVLVVATSAIGVGAISAEEDVPAISDGRVNSWDLAAPVIVYCEFEHPDTSDTDLSILDYIELWGVNPDGYFEQVLIESAEEIDAAGVPTGTSVLLGSGNGYSLYRETDGSFTATAPGDAEGKVYSFNWERGDQNC